MNVKIDSGNIKHLQKSLLEIQKLKTADFKKELLEQKKDVKEISQDSLNLKNLDHDNSGVSYNQQTIDFNLVFNFFQTIQLTTEGKIQREEQSLEVKFKYSFQREVTEDGKKVMKNFLLEMNMKAAFEETISEEKKIEKEDLLQFVQRIVNGIFDAFNDERKSLRSVIIDEKDFQEMMSYGKGELVKMLQALLGAVFSYMKLREMNSKIHPVASVSLYTKRHVNETKEYSVTRIDSFKIEITQQEVEAKEKE